MRLCTLIRVYGNPGAYLTEENKNMPSASDDSENQMFKHTLIRKQGKQKIMKKEHMTFFFNSGKFLSLTFCSNTLIPLLK